MIETKLIEIRDYATCITGVATKINYDNLYNETEQFLMGGIGYKNATAIILTHLPSCSTHDDPYEWGENERTMSTAHNELVKNWDKYMSGDVLDVRYVLVEVGKPADSDLYYTHRLNNE